MTQAPHDLRHLRGSKWTARAPAGREVHWQVDAVAVGRGAATLEAVLTGRRVEIPWRQLRDRSQWLPGWVSRPGRSALVVGAGLAGLSCASALRESGWTVTCVDKGRGAGGRASTRRRDPVRFDHGAQYVTARDPVFAEWLSLRARRGLLARWDAPLVELGAEGTQPLTPRDRFVGVPGMSALLREEAREVGVRFGVRVTSLTRGADGWTARCEDGTSLGPFGVVAVATPAPQAVPLLAEAPDLAERAAAIEVAPCWAVLATFAEALPLGWGGAVIGDGALAWVAHDGSKPGRGGAPTYVLHARPEWSAAHLEDPPAQVVADLLEAFAVWVEGGLPTPRSAEAHRWGYARTTKPLAEPCLWDERLAIGLCGDGCLGARLESAFLSGRALAQRVIASWRAAQ